MKDTKENFTLLPTIDIFNEISKEMQIKGINCNIEQDVLKIFAKHGIIFNSHRYGYTSEYTCPGALLKFDSTSNLFRTGRADFDKKAKLILNDIKYLLPKYKSFHWVGKTISGNARNGEVRTAQN